jgi:crossover junction endodeoxyribonuclease RuvC
LNEDRRLVILGIDPGLNTTGYGVIEKSPGSSPVLVEAGTIRSDEKLALPERLCELFDGIAEVLDSADPDVMGLEEVYSHYKHPATAIIMAHARGVLVLAAQRKGVKVRSLPSTKIKKLVTGNGRASKQQVNGMVRHLLAIQEEVKPLDVSDALAAAIAALEMERYD